MTKLETPIPPNFFGERIYNMTIFVGDNGAGKTTILHYLIDLLRQFYEGRYHGYDRGMLVVEDQKRKYVLKYGKHPLHLENIPDQFECVDFVEKGARQLLSATKLIYLANTLTPSDLALMSLRPEKTDNRYVNLFHFRYEFLYNCSTTSLMVENCKNDSGNPIVAADDYLNCFFSYEQYKQVKYVFDKRQYEILTEWREKDYPVPVPKKLLIQLQRTDYSNVFSNFSNAPPHEDVYFETREEQYDWLVWELCSSCVQTFVKTALLHTEKYKQWQYIEFVRKKAEQWSFRGSRNGNPKVIFSDAVKEIAHIYREDEENRQKTNSLKLITGVMDCCTDFFDFVFQEREHLRQYFEMESLEGKTVGGDEEAILFTIKTTGEAAEWFITFLKKYRYTCEPYYYLKFHWGLSSGEQNLLRLFSSLYYIFDADYNNPERGDYTIYNNAPDMKTSCDSVLLWLDEADLTYHPEWQRRFLSILTAFLPKIYSEACCRDIQVFLTTHSPLMLGDFPAQSVIYLSKDTQGRVTVDDSGSSQTYGENLYALLQNSFATKDGVIGELVRRNIQEILDYLSVLDKKLLPHKKAKVSLEDIHRCRNNLQNFRNGAVSFLADGIIKAKLEAEIDLRLKQLKEYAPDKESAEELFCHQLSSEKLERWLKAFEKEKTYRKGKLS